MCEFCESVTVKDDMWDFDPFDRSSSPYGEIFKFKVNNSNSRIVFIHIFGADEKPDFTYFQLYDYSKNKVSTIDKCPNCNRDLYVKVKEIPINPTMTKNERKRVIKSNQCINEIYNLIKKHLKSKEMQ